MKHYLETGLVCHAMGELEEDYPEDIPIEFTLEGIYQDSYRDYFAQLEKKDGDTEEAILEEVFPLCYKLSDLDKFIPELGITPVDRLIKNDWSAHQIMLVTQNAISHVCFDLVQQLIEWNFWVFDQDYFEKGLVIDKLSKGKEVKSE